MSTSGSVPRSNACDAIAMRALDRKRTEIKAYARQEFGKMLEEIDEALPFAPNRVVRRRLLRNRELVEKRLQQRLDHADKAFAQSVRKWRRGMCGAGEEAAAAMLAEALAE